MAASDKILDKVSGWFRRERDAQSANRIERATDEDFEDSDQWSPEDKAEMEARGQAPLVFNEIKPTIEWLLGTEKRSRADWKIVPRAEDDVKPAERKTKLFKYVSDLTSAEYQRSLAFADAVRSGDGWVKVGVKMDEHGRPEIVYEHCNWREFWPDARSRKADMSDARYLHRARYIDLDDAIAMFPDKKGALETASSPDAAVMSDDTDGVLEEEFEDTGGFRQEGGRTLVRLVETWYREPRRVKVLRGDGPLDGKEYEKSPETDALVGTQYDLVATIRSDVRVCLWVDDCLLHDAPSPYRHGLFPYARVIAYRKKRNGTVYGVIRALRDPQQDLNKRRSKALYAMSVRRVLMEKGAVDDKDLLADEVSRPDSIIEFNHGKEFRIEENGELARGHLDLASADSAYIRLASGVTGENLGLQTNATSGTAIQARQEQGAVVTTSLYDNLRQAMQISGRMVLSLIEQFMTERQQFRITGERGRDEFVTVNDGDPENDITRHKADFAVSEQDWRSSTRQAMAEELIRLAGTLPPQMAMLMIDIAIEMMDVPNKDEIVKRIRKAGGLASPDATPEEEQAEAQQQQAMAQAQAAQAQAEAAFNDAKLAKLKMDSVLSAAKAEREAVAAMKDKLAGLRDAVATAAVVAANPALSQSADEILSQVDALLGQSQQVPDQTQMGNMGAVNNQPVSGQTIAGA